MALAAPYLSRRQGERFLSEIGSSRREILRKTRGRLAGSFPISWESKKSFLDSYGESFPPEAMESVMRESEDIVRNRFDLLGSGVKELGPAIDWSMDFATGRRWPFIRSGELPIAYGDGSDVKRIWELSRFQWSPTLGKACWLSGDDRYAWEFLERVLYWIWKNPYGFGPNWMSSQDVSLRAINWILSLCFLGDRFVSREACQVEILSSLFQHGVHIENNLSTIHDATTGTHSLSELLGLFYLGLLFRDSRKGEEWVRFSSSEYEKEIVRQVHPDGADYESSVAGYHRFALEHFIHAALLARVNGMEVSGAYLERLEKMFEFVVGYSRPDGTVPQIGDTDDGRVHILANHSNWRKDDHRYILRIGGRLFGREDFEQAGGDAGEDGFWLLHRLASAGLLPLRQSMRKRMEPRHSAGFPDSGFYFMKSPEATLAISANPVGKAGKGNHKHNDILGIDLHLGNVPFIVDPGSYVYTADLNERYRFRSTSFHNTLQVNDFEINPIDPGLPWRMKEEARPKVLKWETGERHDLFIGEHSGYARQVAGLKVRRTILFEKPSARWLILDELRDAKELPRGTRISIRFHAGPCKVVAVDTPRKFPAGLASSFDVLGLNPSGLCPEETVRLQHDGSYLDITTEVGNGLARRVRPGWVSPSYGVRFESSVLEYEGNCPALPRFLFVLEAGHGV
jgi:hypothetical protein